MPARNESYWMKYPSQLSSFRNVIRDYYQGGWTETYENNRETASLYAGYFSTAGER